MLSTELNQNGALVEVVYYDPWYHQVMAAAIYLHMTIFIGRQWGEN